MNNNPWIEDFRNVATVLSDDAGVLIANVSDDGPNAGFWKRTAVRAVFADMEAMTFQFRTWLRRQANDSNFALKFSPDEITIIHAIDFYPKPKGVNIPRGAANKFLFTFQMLWKSGNSIYPHDENSAEWVDFKDALRIRNRVVHPTTATDLEISPADLKLIRRVGSWLESQYKSIATVLPDF